MHLHSPTNSYQLQHWICFFFKIWFFFSRTEQKKRLLILILLGVLNILKFGIKSRKCWYSVKHFFKIFVLFYLPFSAQFFVDVKKKLLIKKENITERGRPWPQSIGSEMTGGQSVHFKNFVQKANFWWSIYSVIWIWYSTTNAFY